MRDLKVKLNQLISDRRRSHSMLRDTTVDATCILFDITVSASHIRFLLGYLCRAMKNNEFNALLFPLGGSDTRLFDAHAIYQLI
jgi:hypothetical protein